MFTKLDFTHPKVMILGGGFAGPVLALALEMRGITSAVYELRTEGANQGGNVTLAPNAFRVLDQIGVGDRVRIDGFNYEELHLSNAKGSELGSFQNGSQKLYNYPAVRIHRRDVRNYLLDRLNEIGIPIYFGKKLRKITEEDDTVTAHFLDETDATAELAVGCDGIHSITRRYCFPEADPIFQNFMGIMGTVYPDQLDDLIGTSERRAQYKWLSRMPSFIFGATGLFGIMPVTFSGDEIGFMTLQKAKDRSRAEWDAFDADKPGMKQQVERVFIKEKGGADSPEEVRTLIQRARPDTMTSWPFYIVPEVEHWYSQSGRVIFIGDAAHAIPPTGGQGAAQAFEDAATLALTLGRLYTPNPSNDPHTGTAALGRMELLSRWCKHRQARVKKVYEFTMRNAGLMSSKSSWLYQDMMDWVMWAALKVGGPEAGSKWIYSYHCEDILAALAA